MPARPSSIAPRRSRPTVRAVALVAAAVAAAVVGTGCGAIQERKERADRIIGSVDKAVATGSAQMTVTAEPVLKLADAARLVAQGPQQEDRRTVSFIAAADLAHDRVAYLATGPAGVPEPVRVYAGTTLYARRAGAAAGASNRPWVRLDLTSIDPKDIDNDNIESADALRRVQTTQGFDNPLFLLTLLRGTLAGSVEEVGPDKVGGVATTHYKLNIDREKAVRDEDESIQDAYEVMFKTLFATRTVFPGEVWLDNQGLPRRYSVTLKSSVRRRDLIDFRLTVEMDEVGQPVEVALPDKSQTATVEDLGALSQAVTGGP